MVPELTCVGRAEEDQLSFADVDAAQHAGLRGGAANAQVGVGLQILCERGLDHKRRRGADADIELHVVEQRDGADGRLDRRRGAREQRTDIALRRGS